MLLHAGYSAFEALTYEKSIDPTAALEIPLDVSLQSKEVC
jgi:Membrane magnesium transporter